MTITIDTSIFAELILDQKKAEECESLLLAVAQGKLIATLSHFALHAVEAMFTSQKKLSEFLKNIETSQGLSIYETTVSDEQSVCVLSQKIGLDFDDAIQYYVAKRTGSTEILSFDRHFDGLDIPRREPGQLLKNLR